MAGCPSTPSHIQRPTFAEGEQKRLEELEQELEGFTQQVAKGTTTTAEATRAISTEVPRLIGKLVYCQLGLLGGGVLLLFNWAIQAVLRG